MTSRLRAENVVGDNHWLSLYAGEAEDLVIAIQRAIDDAVIEAVAKVASDYVQSWRTTGLAIANAIRDRGAK